MVLGIILPLALCATAAYLFLRTKFSRKHAPLPPGPPADPILGHLLRMPQVAQDMFFYEMGKKYGNVMHLNVLGRSLVVLNSSQAASDLLEKRSSNYSDRPSLPVFDLVGLGDTFGFLSYGEEFRLQRKIFQQYFSKEKCKDFRHILTREARNLARELASTSENFMDSLLRFSSAVIIDISFGHQVISRSDPYVRIAGDCCRVVTDTGSPGGTLLDLFPFLQHFPSWFPGTFYATLARKSSAKFRKLCEYPFEKVKEQMANGTARPSFLANELEKLNQMGLEQDPASIQRVQAAATIAFIAGAETTSSTLSFFILAMTLHPECVTKAQTEIDLVVGTDRLPEYHDRESLPYLECILQETLRWNQAAPLGVPHRSAEDDEYNGMFIPKGSTIIANTRSMTLDETVYKDPFKFEPERYLPAPLGRGEPYPIGPFGFGRRKCPGRHLANESAWIAMAIIMATMSISRAIGEDGKEIIPEVKIVAVGIASHPTAFACRFVPRAQAQLIMQST